MPELPFAIVKASTVASVIESNRGIICDLVKQAYSAFGAGRAENPNSLFLTFDKVEQKSPDRIIALPAYLNTKTAKVGGVKWISSFPRNLAHGLPRASAVLVLNDLRTGIPFALLEGAHISAARTAASAVLGADVMSRGNRSARRIGFVGVGIIAQTILDFFISSGWQFGAISAFDIDYPRAETFRARAADLHEVNIDLSSTIDSLITDCDLIVFATTASVPHVHDVGLFRHNPHILHISLRDLSPDIILKAHNIVDDTEHCLKARTSIHLAAAEVGGPHFIHANIYDCFNENGAQDHDVPDDRPAVYSPFGMGILDIAVADFVFRTAVSRNEAICIDGFFSEH